VAAAVTAASAAPAMAFDGIYGERCTPQGDDAPVTVRGDRIEFYETGCQMTNPVRVRGLEGAVLFDLRCSGEGETWEERAFLQPDRDGGLILVWRGLAMMLPRCD